MSAKSGQLQFGLDPLPKKTRKEVFLDDVGEDVAALGGDAGEARPADVVVVGVDEQDRLVLIQQRLGDVDHPAVGADEQDAAPFRMR